MPATNETVTNVLRLANEVNSVARQAGRADLSEVLAQVAARWKETETTIVVAGAQKRGKSRLINALVGRPGLVPVDADVSTNCYLSLRHGPVLTATVNQAGGSFPIDPEQIPEYASMSGDPAKRRDVVSVDLTMEHPLLEGVRLLDTPGVDSLTVGHRQATVSILQRADALLFAMSAQDQPVLRHELEFLAEAVERVQAVAFVLTKVEDSANWQSLLAENRRRLEAFVTEISRADPDSAEPLQALLNAPWLPVSAKLAEAAAAQRAMGRPDRADQLLARSGMDRLEEYIRACAGGRELARSATVVSACGSVLAAMGALAEDDVAGSSDDAEDSTKRIAEVEKALEDLTETTRERRRHGVGIQFLGREVAGIVRSHLTRVRQPYEQAISALSTRAELDRYMEQLPESVERSVQAAWEDITAEVGTLVGKTLNTFLAALGLDPMEMDLAKVALPKVWSHDLSSDPAESGKIDMLREGVPHAMMAITMGMMLASFVTPALFVVGPALAAAVLTRKRQWEQIQRNQNALKRLLMEQFGQASNEMTLVLEREVANWRVTVEQSADQALIVQKRELETRRAELRAAAARTVNERKAAREKATKQLASITSLTDRCASLRGQIAAAVNSMAASETTRLIPRT